jgi:hypothetical protein
VVAKPQQPKLQFANNPKFLARSSMMTVTNMGDRATSPNPRLYKVKNSQSQNRGHLSQTSKHKTAKKKQKIKKKIKKKKRRNKKQACNKCHLRQR